MNVRRSLVEHPPPSPLQTPCRLWQGAVNSSGYGYVYQDARPVLLHRWVVAAIHGWDAIAGKIVMHLCDHPLCYRYDHLRIGTDADNSADRVRKGRSASHAGTLNGRARLSEGDVCAIRSSATGERGEIVAFARRYNVSEGAIRGIVKGRTWRHLRHDDGAWAVEDKEDPDAEA